MRSLTLVLLLLSIACSSTKEKSNPRDKITNESFKKERPLSTSEFSDFYRANAKALSPALQDETLDRLSSKEVGALKGEDPLMEIAISCARKDFKKAFATASRTFDKYQKIPAYWNQVANCHLKQGSDRKALLFYNKALELSKNYVPALNNIGVLYTRQGQDQKALVAFERAQKHSRFAKTPRYNLAKLQLSYGLAEKAVPILQSLLEESPKDVDLLNSLGSAYFLLGDHRKAAAYYARIPRSLWNRPEIGLNYAWTLKKLGDKKSAAKVFEAVERPKDDELRRYYSVVSSQLGARK